MEIIKEINYDWMWKVGLVLLIIGIILFIILIIFKSELSAIGVPGIAFGISFLVVGVCYGSRFRVKLNDTYTVCQLIEQCESVKYEPDYGTWLVRFKEDNNEIR